MKQARPAPLFDAPDPPKPVAAAATPEQLEQQRRQLAITNFATDGPRPTLPPLPRYVPESQKDRMPQPFKRNADQ